MTKKAANVTIFFVFFLIFYLIGSKFFHFNQNYQSLVFPNDLIVVAASNEDKNQNKNEDKVNKKEEKLGNGKLNNNNDNKDSKNTDLINQSSKPSTKPIKLPTQAPLIQTDFVVPQIVQESFTANFTSATPTIAPTMPSQPRSYQRLIQAPVELLFRNNPRQYYFDNFMSSSSTNILIAISLLTIVFGISILKFSHKLLFSIF